jgi:hypothetical protein
MKKKAEVQTEGRQPFSEDYIALKVSFIFPNGTSSRSMEPVRTGGEQQLCILSRAAKSSSMDAGGCGPEPPGADGWVGGTLVVAPAAAIPVAACATSSTTL